jgi:hypothetical protein
MTAHTIVQFSGHRLPFLLLAANQPARQCARVPTVEREHQIVLAHPASIAPSAAENAR